MVDPRFAQLIDKARSGDDCAIADLWHEFGFDFRAECPSAEGGASC